MALTLTESWVRRINVGFRPLLESSSLVSTSQLILQGPFPHTKAGKDPPYMPTQAQLLPQQGLLQAQGLARQKDLCKYRYVRYVGEPPLRLG